MDSVRKKYADRLVDEGLTDQEQITQAGEEYRTKLDSGEPVVELVPDEDALVTVDWEPYLEADWRDPAETSLARDELQRLGTSITTIPEGFKLHRQVERIIESRRKMASGDLPMDWGFAETMAYASLIKAGHGLRLVGQDSGRGTFFHRHAVLHEQNTGAPYVPLSQLTDNERKVTIIDSLLSEEAVLGFEYGYATADPGSLVIWEAQFGDFVNGAQVVIDQFITSGETKWGRLCGLVMFLPHGYEGQGPEHSSARLERFMQLSSGNNIQVCVPSVPSQMFHMLRRQMLRPFRKPLIVMTPKSLLRNKASTSTLEELEHGSFQVLIDDPVQPDPEQVKRIVFCAGKVYFDLAAEQAERNQQDVAVVRVEQLYPFPREELQAIIGRYSQAQEVVWCQEEPMNQGAWFQIRHHIQACTRPEQTLKYAGREASASPAVGYYQVHQEQQKRLVSEALTHGKGIE
jgi:2-oxoglutarate dehydrogenase E1 component